MLIYVLFNHLCTGSVDNKVHNNLHTEEMTRHMMFDSQEISHYMMLPPQDVMLLAFRFRTDAALHDDTFTRNVTLCALCCCQCLQLKLCRTTLVMTQIVWRWPKLHKVLKRQWPTFDHGGKLIETCQGGERIMFCERGHPSGGHFWCWTLVVG